MRRTACCCAVILLTVAATLPRGQSGAGPSQAAREPRIPAIRESDWTAEQRQLVAEFAPLGQATPALRTFLVHPDLVRGVMPFANYIVAASTLTPRDRALLVLRTAWLARSEYLWAEHARDAAEAGLTADDLARVAAGASAPGWGAFDAALLRAADELHRSSFIGDSTWTALAGRYGVHQLMDAVFTVAEFTMLAGTVNSLGVRLDGPPADPLPGALALPALPRTHTPAVEPRIPPLDPAVITPEVRAMLDPSGSGRSIAAVYRTFAQHPSLYVPRQMLSEYIRLRNTLPPRVREMLILRIGYLCGSAYEWAAHARAGRAAGLTPDEIARLARPLDDSNRYADWTAADAAVVRSADELFTADAIGDATWRDLASQFDRRQLLDLLITTGGYRMVSMALNTFGVPLEPNSERMPGR